MRRVALLATVAALAMLSGSAPEGEQWGERAVQWIEARDRAAHRSVAELLMFESPDTIHLFCCNQWPWIDGRDALAAFVSGAFGEAIDEETMGRAYVDVSGAVVEYRFGAGPDDDRPVGGGDPVGPSEVQVSDIGSDGAATRTVHAVSLQFLGSPVDDGRTFYGDDLGAAKRLTDRYLTAWSGSDAATVGGLYSENARVLDSVLGLRLSGRDAIESYAGRRGRAELREDSIPDGGGPALYGFWAEYQRHLTVYLIYTGDDGEGCPGGVAAELQVEQGQIVAERRYHDVASIRRCANSAELTDGWWTTAAIPAPAEDRVTGTVTAAGQRIEVHNGTPGADELVRWAMARFPAADLTAPTVGSIAFSEEAHRAQCAGGRWGLALQDGSSSRIFLCYTVGSVATPIEQAKILHELAHVWMWQNLDEERKEQFDARMHLPTWDALETPWDQRGVEQAAGVIAWGLGDENLKSEAIGTRSCPDLADAFELLTGVAPLQPPCPSGE